MGVCMENFTGGENDNIIIIPTVVAIDGNNKRNNQHAVKWAIDNIYNFNGDNLRSRNESESIVLLHVITTQHNQHNLSKEGRRPTTAEMKQLFLPYRGFCAKKGIRPKEVILEDIEITKALCNYIYANSITTIVVGASQRSVFSRAFKNNTGMPTSLGNCVPEFCKVYVVSKGKVVKIKSPHHIDEDSTTPSKSNRHRKTFSRDSWRSFGCLTPSREYRMSSRSKTPSPQSSMDFDDQTVNQIVNISPANKKNLIPTSVSSAKTSSESLSYYASSSHNSGSGDSYFEHNRYTGSSSRTIKSVNQLNNARVAGSTSGSSTGQSFPSNVSFEHLDNFTTSHSSTNSSSISTQPIEIDDEVMKLKQELKEITEKYNIACQEAVTTRDDYEVEKAIHAQEAALAIVGKERQKYEVAIEVAHKAQRIAELEAEKRKHAEMNLRKESKAKQFVVDQIAHNGVVRCRRYSIDEIQVCTNNFSDAYKIGEGSYGPVYKASLHHTPVAIKVLKPDVSQGLKQFQREIEVLGRIRHPHTVTLLGACPDYGCLVYEYMENGSLEDRLSCNNNSQPLSWKIRFKIAAEIATALNFLHQAKPEPLVHRDLKPANILLDINYCSKISDMGLARLVPSSFADSMTSAVGTFCYIDPEYQQTGTLGTKSDLYSLGIVLLQIITAKCPMGLISIVEDAIEMGDFAGILDENVKDWPVDETLSFAKLALKCCELRRRDRPDLDTVILPELERLRDLGDSEMEAVDDRSYFNVYSQTTSYQQSSIASILMVA